MILSDIAPPPSPPSLMLLSNAPPQPPNGPGLLPTFESGPLFLVGVGRVLGHSIAIDEKISQLNELWPEIVRKYEARVREELDDPELFRQRYEALIYGPQ